MSFAELCRGLGIESSSNLEVLSLLVPSFDRFKNYVVNARMWPKTYATPNMKHASGAAATSHIGLLQMKH